MATRGLPVNQLDDNVSAVREGVAKSDATEAVLPTWDWWREADDAIQTILDELRKQDVPVLSTPGAS